MITKYICSYCREEFSDIDKCRAHEDKCADTFKNELWIFVYGIGGMNGRAFLEKGIAFNDISIIQNKGANAFFLFSDMMDKNGYTDPTDATIGMIRQGFYYWSDYSQSWQYTKEWDDALTRIVLTGIDIEDE